jgi:hypothetical protein
MPRTSISVPRSLQPLLNRPADWPLSSWRVAVAACRASGVVAWAARLESPTPGEPRWLQGCSPSQPQVVQSECVPGLIAALEAIPVAAAVEVIAPTSLRYLVEGAAFPPGSPQHHLAQLATARRIWARYALGELEAPVGTCLSRAYDSLAPLRWSGQQSGFVLYTDGGCTPEACAAAWVLRRDGTTIAERAWTLDARAAPDRVRLAEFSAAADGLTAVPDGAPVAVVSDHADLSDFGVQGVPAFRPSQRVAGVLEAIRAQSGAGRVSWYWAEHGETDGQRRCQALIDRQVRAAPAYDRFIAACATTGLRQVWLPDFERWLAPRAPLVDDPHEDWAATFERRDCFVAATPEPPRLYLRQLRLTVRGDQSFVGAFAKSTAGGWCDDLVDFEPLAGAQAGLLMRLRSGFVGLALLFEPDAALIIQTRPGARLEHVLDAAATVQRVSITGI